MSSENSMMERMDRQMRVLGKEAMKRMQESQVVIISLSGLGQEVAKNMILMGAKSVFLCDDEIVSWDDLSSGFYISEKDIGKNRVDACIGEMKSLNIDVKVERIKRADLTKEFLQSIHVVCFTDDPIFSLVEMNKLCRETKTRFVATEIRGLFGAIFSDMGDEFVVFDDNGEPVAENTVVDISNEKEAMVTVLDDSNNHGLYLNDKVVFSNVEGMEKLNSIGAVEIDTGEGCGKYTFRIKVDTTEYPPYKKGTGYCKQVKIPKKMKFLPLEESIKDPKVIDYDWGKFEFGKAQCHPLWRASFDFLKEHKRYPKTYCEEDALKLLELVKKYNETPNEEFVKLYSYTCRGKINPMAAMLGGFAAQELQKAISGKFTPLNQWFYIDALECLDKDALPTEEETQPKNCRYDGNIRVFGKPFQDKLLEQKIFVVGAGALGCEYLKNFALLGVGASPKGELRVTDMDSIEVSNLNRQFLFRDKHVGKMKSTCAAETAQEMNPSLNMKPMTDKVATETEEVFNDDFWSSLDCAVNALDNIKTRLYIDSKCLYYGKPLIEAGTLGPKANTQTVIPHVSESYGAQRDPPEKGFAICTLKSFPYKIEHCIAWGRGKFEGYFTAGPKIVNSYLEKEDYIVELRKEIRNTSEVIAKLEIIHKLLVKERPTTFQKCVEWSRLAYENHFTNDIVQLLHTCPLDSKTKEGLPFWFGSKRPPIPLEGSKEENMISFVKAAAMIRAEMYGIQKPEDYKWEEGIGQVEIPKFEPKSGVKIVLDDDEEETEGEESGGGDDDEEKIKEIIKALPKPSEMGRFRLNVIVFEKDDDTNHHIDFITASSNSRASNYKIPLADRFKTKGIVGNIIPAMVTTTALITGFGTIEFLKVVAGKKDIESYRNAYVNLALPYIAMTEPMAPKKVKCGDIEVTDWDFIDVDLKKDCTIGEFVEHFKEKHKVVVCMIMFAKAMVYNSMGEGGEERLLSEAAFETSEVKPLKGQKWISLALTVEDLEEEDIDEYPTVRYRFRDFD